MRTASQGKAQPGAELDSICSPCRLPLNSAWLSLQRAVGRRQLLPGQHAHVGSASSVIMSPTRHT